MKRGNGSISVALLLTTGCVGGLLPTSEMGTALYNEETQIERTCVDLRAAPPANAWDDLMKTSVGQLEIDDFKRHAKALATYLKATAGACDFEATTNLDQAKRCLTSLREASASGLSSGTGAALALKDAAKHFSDLWENPFEFTRSLQFSKVVVHAFERFARTAEELVDKIIDDLDIPYVSAVVRLVARELAAELIAVALDGLVDFLDKHALVSRITLAEASCERYHGAPDLSIVTARGLKRIILGTGLARIAGGGGPNASLGVYAPNQACESLGKTCNNLIEKTQDRFHETVPGSSGIAVADPDIEVPMQSTVTYGPFQPLEFKTTEEVKAPPQVEADVITLASEACTQEAREQGTECDLERFNEMGAVVTSLIGPSDGDDSTAEGGGPPGGGLSVEAVISRHNELKGLLRQLQDSSDALARQLEQIRGRLDVVQKTAEVAAECKEGVSATRERREVIARVLLDDPAFALNSLYGKAEPWIVSKDGLVTIDAASLDNVNRQVRIQLAPGAMFDTGRPTTDQCASEDACTQFEFNTAAPDRVSKVKKDVSTGWQRIVKALEKAKLAKPPVEVVLFGLVDPQLDLTPGLGLRRATYFKKHILPPTGEAFRIVVRQDGPATTNAALSQSVPEMRTVRLEISSLFPVFRCENRE